VAKYLSVLLSILIFNATSIAQTLPPDTAFVSAGRENTKSFYVNTMKEQNQLYNGGDYLDYRPLKDEHPYYISEDWITGSVQYNNEQYDDVSLLYNIHTDDIITEQPSSAIMIKLIRDKVQSFSIEGHQFVMIKDSKDLSTGFYDQLCSGKVNLYAKRIKDFQETISGAELQRIFTEKNRYYLYKDGHYYSIKSKKSILTVLGDRKKELNQFIRQNHIHVRQNREAAFIKLTEYYNGN
jgi:hypothetical protein